MSFFERNRAALAKKGIDASRLPPGQYSTDRFPVLHVGDVPSYSADLSDWSLAVTGLVGTPRSFSWEEIRALPVTRIVADIHCVTKWSKFDTEWEGVSVSDLLAAAGGPDSRATHVLEHAERGYTTNVPLEDVLDGQAIVAWSFDGAPLEPEHGGPLRMVVPKLYFWKSAKWLRGIELLDRERLGFWEENGYHAYGDPFREQRFS